MNGQARPRLGTRILAMLLLAAALAYVEADVVVYLREVLVPLRRAHFPAALREPLPLLNLQQLAEAGPQVASFHTLEQVRELAALAVLAAMAAALKRRKGEAWAFFLVSFALWDFLYYAFLKALMGWPASLSTWDVLFLVPVPWVAPVWAPLAVSATLLLAGVISLATAGREMPTKVKLTAGLMALAGAALVLASFLLRARQAVGGVPKRFDWPWFLAGWLLGSVGLLWLAMRPSRRRR